MNLREIAALALAEDADRSGEPLGSLLTPVLDFGTSEGARKGWETRRRGVSASSLASALDHIIADDKVDVRFRSPAEREALVTAAKDFHAKYGPMRIPLPIGREVFFSPSEQAVERHNGDLAAAWAEYAIHAVSNDNVDENGKHYRAYNAEKVKNVIPRIREIIDADNTRIVKDDRVAYHLQLDDKHMARVIARPEHGNLCVDDFVEVTAVYLRGKAPPAVPLYRAIVEWKAGRGPSLNSAT